MHSKSEVDLSIQSILNRITEAENYYKSLEPLHFRRKDGSVVVVKKTNDAKSFCAKFFDKFNWEFRTFYNNSKNLYTTIDTRRSIGDVFRLAYSILGSKITLADIIVATQNLVLQEDPEVGTNWCYEINRRVYKDREDNNGCYYNENQHDELGFTKAHYKLLIDHLK